MYYLVPDAARTLARDLATSSPRLPRHPPRGGGRKGLLKGPHLQLNQALQSAPELNESFVFVQYFYNVLQPRMISTPGVLSLRVVSTRLTIDRLLP